MASETPCDIKVLMTADAVGGVWNYCLELCRALPQVKFFLVTAGAPLQNHQHEEIALLPNVKLAETTYKLEWMQCPWEDIDASGAWMLQLEKEIAPHLVHLNSYAYAALPFRAPKIVVAHSDVYSWWHSVKKGTPGAEWATYFQRVKRGLESANCVIGISKASLELMLQLYGVRVKTRTIYNGRKLAPPTAAAERTGVMAMGRIWDEAKNIKLLLEAAPHIQGSLKIAGDRAFEDNNPYLQQGGVQFLGRLNATEITNELAAAAVFALPARYEPFGLSPLEAAICGCALVLGDIPTLREIWQDAALFVNPDDAHELAAVVNALIAQPQLRAEMALKAGARAAQFSTLKMAMGYLKLYRELSAVQI